MDTFSPTITYEMKIRNTGVSARNGIVRLMGETFSARVYKIRAIISRGMAHNTAIQKVLSRGGISINSKHPKRRGKAKINLAQATKYSSLDDNARFVNASLVARERAVKRE